MLYQEITVGACDLINLPAKLQETGLTYSLLAVSCARRVNACMKPEAGFVTSETMTLAVSSL